MAWSPPITDEQCIEAYTLAQSIGQAQAAIRIGIPRGTLANRIRAGMARRLFGDLPPVQNAPVAVAAAPRQPSTSVDPIRLDQIERHRFTEEISALRAQTRDLTKRLAEAEDHRASILGLNVEPLEPVIKPRKPVSKKSAAKQAVVLHLSDLHVGEVVDRAEVMGVNEYNLAIAEKRIARLFNASSILTTTAWPASDAPPSKIYILLGGDLVSGAGLHPELAETDAGTAYEQSKLAADYIASGVLQLHTDIKDRYGKPIPIDIISVVGNHGRMTFGKPRAKLASIQSYDTLVSDFIEAALKKVPTIRHYRPRGFDAYFDVVGWPCLLTHGDRMGSGGGTGFIGAMSSIIKGHRKILDTEHRQRRPVYRIFTGHFHTTGVTSFGFSNGAGVGYGEFAKSIRADPEPAQQNLVVFHERLGVLRWHPIAMGDQSEGSIYQPTSGLILPDLQAAS